VAKLAMRGGTPPLLHATLWLGASLAQSQFYILSFLHSYTHTHSHARTHYVCMYVCVCVLGCTLGCSYVYTRNFRDAILFQHFSCMLRKWFTSKFLYHK